MPHDDLDPADAALAAALARVEPDPAAALTRDELAVRTGLSVPLLEAIEREGFLQPEGQGYGEGDVEVLQAGLALLEAGVPLGELLDLARRFDRSVAPLAEEAVEAFVRFVRDPAHAEAETPQEAAERMVGAFQSMLPAVAGLVGYRFRTLLIAAAHRRVEGAS